VRLFLSFHTDLIMSQLQRIWARCQYCIFDDYFFHLATGIQPQPFIDYIEDIITDIIYCISDTEILIFSFRRWHTCQTHYITLHIGQSLIHFLAITHRYLYCITYYLYYIFHISHWILNNISILHITQYQRLSHTLNSQSAFSHCTETHNTTHDYTLNIITTTDIE